MVSHRSCPEGTASPKTGSGDGPLGAKGVVPESWLKGRPVTDEKAEKGIPLGKAAVLSRYL